MGWLDWRRMIRRILPDWKTIEKTRMHEVHRSSSMSTASIYEVKIQEHRDTGERRIVKGDLIASESVSDPGIELPEILSYTFEYVFGGVEYDESYSESYLKDEWDIES